GFFMHARGGLQTEYMGEEWFENVTASVDEANKRGMHAWAYDENGWPSGFGGGKVNGKGEKYWQKYLRVKKFTPDLEDIRGPRVIGCFENYCFYYDVNPFYVDTLDGEVIADFIHEIYDPYYEKYGSTFDGFFTDEPQISRNGIPWSLTLPAEYKKAYGENLLDNLIDLFIEDRPGYQETRMKFWKLITELFSRNFMKQIHDWCVSHGVKFTGHLVLEETYHSQLVSNGACMPHYEYFDIPGMDWLGRDINRCLTQHQLASAAAQTGKKQILSETFALCGHNVGHEELKRNYEWMMVRGINLMCQHLEGYSLRGIRKRDYPPAMYCQQPWWADYKVFNDAMSRVGMLLAEGQIKVDTLVMHTQTSAWICYNDKDNGSLADWNVKLLDIIDQLEAKHIPFHLGDEILMERHGRVEGDTLVIGEMKYKKVIIPPHIAFLPGTEKLLAEFKANGGEIVTVDELPANPIIDNPKITYTLREFPADGFTMRYFVNSTAEEQAAVIACGGKVLDIATGELAPFTGSYTFPAWGSLVIIDDGTPAKKPRRAAELPVLDLSGEWDVKKVTENALTLDKCTYWFDGKLQEENGYILNVGSRALDLKRPVDIKCAFTVKADYVPRKLYLACETPGIFEITVNGKTVDTSADCGFFRDHSFRKLDISGLLKKGDNVIETHCLFKQSPEVYENIEKGKIFESEKNKLTYDMEIEAMYLVGNFGVVGEGTFEEIPHKASFFDGTFKLVAPKKKVTLEKLERQGLLFFSGELTVTRTLNLSKTAAKKGLALAFNKEGINAVRVKVNGKEITRILWAPFGVSLKPYLVEGENKIELTLVNNLRNLLGPHHHAAGELYAVAPPHFYNEPCIWNGYHGGYYTDKYCFVNTSLKNQ
ncbi:MAG: hypothetical protein MJ192_02555, partial [Clostridia bacterium]|nr:hypothetical protein [Clostridia bacterium]